MPDCGDVMTEGWVRDTSGDSCNLPCVSNSSQSCGGSDVLEIYYRGPGDSQLTPDQPTIVQSTGSWKYVGCFR
jgi:hypothetical protein